MDARSIAATAANQGVITAATDLDYQIPDLKYCFDGTVYKKRVYYGYGKADASVRLVTGPNIVDWPPMDELHDNILMRFSAVIHDPVTTTDELIPSGDTASYRSNPIRLAEYALCRRFPVMPVLSVHSGGGRGEKTGKNAGGAGSGDETIWY